MQKINNKKIYKVNKSTERQIYYSGFLLGTIKNSRPVFFKVLTKVVMGTFQWCLGVPGLNIALKVAARCLTMIREAVVSKDFKSGVNFRDAFAFGRMVVIGGLSEESMGLIPDEVSVSGDQTSSITSTSNSTSSGAATASNNSGGAATTSNNSGATASTSNNSGAAATTSNSDTNSVSRAPQEGYTTPASQGERIRTNPDLRARGNNLANVNNPQGHPGLASSRVLNFDQ